MDEPDSPQRLSDNMLLEMNSVEDCEELAYKLLARLPRSRLATIQRRLAPLLQFDVVGSLPTEVSLEIFSRLTYGNLLTCSLVSRRWNLLANDQTVWANLCHTRGWEWRQPTRVHRFDSSSSHWGNSDDEGMGDSDEEDEVADSLMSSRQDKFRSRHSAPSILNSLNTTGAHLNVDYKLLFRTHIRLLNRFLSSSYRLTALQTRAAASNGHTNTIYCLQLYTYPSTGVQVLFTGSKDKTVREWNLRTGLVERVIGGVHASSVLSICAYNGYLASAGSDRRVAVWDLERNRLVKVIEDHEDSVLCVRFDEHRLVSCSKDRSIRTYTFPDLKPQFVLGKDDIPSSSGTAHRAAVNAVSISSGLIVSGSGDRSIRLWDANTGKLLRTFENHHSRGIASIDFKPPYILSGSSDKHLRVFDITNLQGWSTAPSPDSQFDHGANVQHGGGAAQVPFVPAAGLGLGGGGVICNSCGSSNVRLASVSTAGESSTGMVRCIHGDLVRSVALGNEFVLSGSYDLSIKVWDRKTGALVADLTGGHTGRIFCIGFDYTKIVSCGEDQRICIWDFSHGIDTSFINF